MTVVQVYQVVLYGNRVIRVSCYSRSIAIFASCFMESMFLKYRVIRGLGQYFFGGLLYVVLRISRVFYFPIGGLIAAYRSIIVDRIIYRVCRYSSLVIELGPLAIFNILCWSERVFPTSIKFVLICSIDTCATNCLSQWTVLI